MLARPINDSVDVSFNIFGQTKVVRLAFDNYIDPNSTYYDEIVELKGKIHLEKQFGAIKAYNSIHNKCNELHKGADGISKTWEEVDVHVKSLILNTSFVRTSN